MADKVVPGPVEGSAAVREAVCIHTRKIFDACRDKDCVEDLRVYPTVSSQTKLDSSLSVRPRSAELLCADVRVKEITFNKGYYTVDVTYFYRVRGETFPGCEPVSGLAIFDKRVMLFGSQASVKMFASDGGDCAPCEEGLPVGVVESVDPIALHMKLVDCTASGETDPEPHAIPQAILDAMGEALSLTCSGKKLLVTLGQFSIIRLERDIQLLMPAYDVCLPRRDCSNSGVGGEQDPCEIFSSFDFPIDAFFPPQSDKAGCLFTGSAGVNDNRSGCGCGNNNSCSGNNSCR